MIERGGQPDRVALATLEGVLTVSLTIRELPPNADTAEGYNRFTEMRTREVSSTAESYATALDDCRAQVPDGWRSVGILVNRP